MKKQIILSIGAFITSLSPIVTVIACSNDKEQYKDVDLTNADIKKMFNDAITDSFFEDYPIENADSILSLAIFNDETKTDTFKVKIKGEIQLKENQKLNFEYESEEKYVDQKVDFNTFRYQLNDKELIVGDEESMQEKIKTLTVEEKKHFNFVNRFEDLLIKNGKTVLKDYINADYVALRTK